MMKIKNIGSGVALIAALSLGLSACGDADEPAPSSSPSSSSPSDEPSSSSPTVESDSYAETVVLTEHGIRVGNENAKTKVQIVTDMQCPYCKNFSEPVSASVYLAIDEGDISIEYFITDFLNENSPGGWSTMAANALNTVANSAESPSWLAAYTSLYSLQPESDDDIVNTDELLVTLKRAGLLLSDDEKAQIEGNSYVEKIAGDTEHAFTLGVELVPAVIVNGTMEDSLSDSDVFIEFLETGKVPQE